MSGLKVQGSLLVALVIGAVLLVGGVTKAQGDTGGPALVNETVTNADGTPASGAQVVVFVDHDTSLDQVGTATVDSNGAWQLAVTPDAALSSTAAANGGYVNFVAFIGTPTGGTGVVYFSRQLTAMGLWAGTDGTLQESSVPLNGLPPSDPGGQCQYGIFIINQSDSYSDMAELHVAKDTTATYTYGQSADTNFDVGVNTGSGWGLSGATHVGNSQSASISWTRSVGSSGGFGHRLQSNYHSIERKIVQFLPWDPCQTTYDAKTTAWNGGATVGQDNSQYDYNCINSPYQNIYANGTTFNRSSNKAAHFTFALNLFGLVWIGADSGYSTSAKVSYQFGNGQSQHMICGNDDYPVRAHRIFAGSHL